MSNISKNLKILRKYKNLTQKQLGELIGYSNRAVGDWELGVSEPNLNTLKKLKDVFGVSYEDLLDWISYLAPKLSKNIHTLGFLNLKHM